MKSKLIVAAFTAFAAGTVQAQGMKGMDTKDMKGMPHAEQDKASTGVHKATGVVTRVDKEKVMIKHDPVPSLNWPVMTMAFVAKDPKMLEKMKPGAKVDFSFTKSGSQYLIVDVR
jgi:Cu(I)/Ag(I) efflux system protein CusF